MSKNDRINHMKLMSKNGNNKLKELHSNKEWRREKGRKISLAKSKIPIEKKPEWELYENAVDKITRESWIYHYDKINPNNLPRGKNFELDHRYSKHQGFLNNVPAEIIGHYTNLQIITRYDNRKKYNKCSITLEELLNSIKT
jgi:hypothetical protein